MKRLRKKIPWFALVFVLAAAMYAAPAVAKDYLYVPCSNTLHIIDCDTDTVTKTLSYNDYVIGGAASDDGRRYYINAWRSIYAIDTDRQQIVDRYEFWTPLNRVNVGATFAVSPDGRRLYMIWMVTKKKMNVPKLNVLPQQFVIFDMAKRQVVKNYEVPAGAMGVISLKDDPDHVVILGLDVFKLNVKTGETEKILGLLHPAEGGPVLNSLALINNRSPGDHGLFCGPAYGGEDRLRVLDPGDSDLEPGRVVDQAVYAQAMQKVMMAGGKPPAAYPLLYYLIIDGRGKARLLEADHFAMLYSSVISPDTRYLYAAMDELYKVDMKTGKAIAFDTLARGTVYSVATTADGRKVYAGPAGPDLVVYNAETMKQIGMIPLKADGVAMTRITK